MTRRHVQHYDRLTRWGSALDAANRERVANTLDMIGRPAGLVLDVGCGDGSVTNPLANSGFDVTGVDISVQALRHFAGHAVIASLDRLPFRNRVFDVSVCAEVLEHLPAGLLAESEREIGRVAGRCIVISTPNREHLPGGTVRCGACGSRYHRNLHLRSMDSGDHRALFSGFACDETRGVGAWQPTPLLTFVQQQLFGIYGYRPDDACPACGVVSPRPARPSRVVRAVLRFAGLFDRVLVRARPRWIATRYTRAASGDPAKPGPRPLVGAAPS